MRRTMIFLACALALSACAPVEVPAGEYVGTCTGAGRTVGAVLTVDAGELDFELCRAALIGYDGERFDVEPASCLLDGSAVEILDGWGTASNNRLLVNLEMRLITTDGSTPLEMSCEGTLAR